jgi:hypothetical protein
MLRAEAPCDNARVFARDPEVLTYRASSQSASTPAAIMRSGAVGFYWARQA